MRNIRATLLKRGQHGKIEIKVLENFEDNLNNIYKLLECSTIDMIIRKINGRMLTLIVDDEYLISDKPIDAPMGVFVAHPSREQLFGNILITGLCDIDGNLTSLDHTDINAILWSIYHVGTLESENYFETLGYSI